MNANLYLIEDYENETARMIISFGGSPSSCAGLELVDAESSRKYFVVLD